MAASPTTVATVVGTAQGLGVDPLLALADALQESGLNPTAVGDHGTSFGLFQLHQGGELGSLTPSEAFDPATNARVALSEFATVAAARPGATPGAIAAAAERPANQGDYAASVNTTYQALSAHVGPPPPAGSSGFTGWLKKAWDWLGRSKGSPLAPGAGFQAADSAAVSAGKGALGGIASGIAQDALRVGLEIVFVLAGLALLIFGLTRMFPGVTRTVTSTIGEGGRVAALAAA